ncbi:MAG: aromatic amino acid lyase, partial [Anaerolineaceae bacterium]|nr:aromatic amino acid lyase [Anaerolineaceae bacterium]
HNANAMTAARHAFEILQNIRQILSIEIYTAVRAITLRKNTSNNNLGAGTNKIYNQIIQKVGFIPEDTLWGEEIKIINDMIVNKEIRV